MIIYLWNFWKTSFPKDSGLDEKLFFQKYLVLMKKLFFKNSLKIWRWEILNINLLNINLHKLLTSE